MLQKEARRAAGALVRGVRRVIRRLGGIDPGRSASSVFGARIEMPIPGWYDFNFVEPSIQLALRDLCRPGDVLFDVGASAGALSMLMSRLVGPRGLVFSFEASRRVVDKTQFNLAQAGCGNVQIFHRAVYRESGLLLEIHEGAGSVADSIYSKGSGNKTMARSIALDDFARHWDAKPSLIKMDIEGAEFDALQGAERLIAETKPHLILEQSPDDQRCIDSLKERGYEIIDLATYRRVRSLDDYPSKGGVANILCLHPSRRAETPYPADPAPELVMELKADELGAITLEAGRYTIEALMTAQGQDNEIYATIETADELLLRYHTFTAFLAGSYRHMPFHLDRTERVAVKFQFLNGTSDPTFRVDGAKVWRVPALSEVRHHLS